MAAKAETSGFVDQMFTFYLRINGRERGRKTAHVKIVIKERTIR